MALRQPVVLISPITCCDLWHGLTFDTDCDLDLGLGSLNVVCVTPSVTFCEVSPDLLNF